MTTNAQMKAALWEIYNRAPSEGEDVSFLIAQRALLHYHVAGTTVGKHIDECAECGRDLRNAIHIRESLHK